MDPLVLYVGTKNLSSWSLRAYLALAHVGVPFEDLTILLDREDTEARIRAVTPSGRVPCLRHGSTVIWDSLAICEYLAETFPDAKLWPANRAARARARSIAAEMHSGFAAMRRDLPMDLRAFKPGEGHSREALADAARVMAIWRECLAASRGPFLFGHFTVADAMYAPVTTRFTTYAVPMDDVCRAYVAAIEALPAMEVWRVAAEIEPV
jgi:glutathione S-transferase